MQKHMAKIDGMHMMQVASPATQQAVSSIRLQGDEFATKKRNTITGCKITEAQNGLIAADPSVMEDEDPFGHGNGMSPPDEDHPMVGKAKAAVAALPGQLVGGGLNPTQLGQVRADGSTDFKENVPSLRQVRAGTAAGAAPQRG
jgi:hypothetical protein